MNFNRVLLITPPVKVDQGSLRPNIGLGYLAQALEDNNISHDILDMMLGYSFDDLKNKIIEFKPDLVGINIFSNKYKTTYRTIENIKKAFPELKIIAGGPHISCLKSQALKDCGALDYGVYLEGEQALVELCRGVDVASIKNIIYRRKDSVIDNDAYDFIDNLDSIAFPKYSKFEMSKYIEEKSLVSSRGCPFNCIYCAVSKVIGKKVRIRSSKNVVDEIEYWYKKGFRQFSFQDDNFNNDKDRVFEICNEIEKRKFVGIFLRCAGARADKLDRDLLKRMKEVGFKTIAIGVEGGNNKILQVLKKGEKFETVENAVKSACELGYDVYLNFLLGSPSESRTDVEDAVRFSMKYPVFFAEWSNIIPYPGTELYGWLQEKGYFLKKSEDYLNDNSTVSNIPVFETPEMPEKERRKLLRYTKRIKNKILRNAVIRRLSKSGFPYILSYTVGLVVSINCISRALFSNKLRKIADKIRFAMYMRKINE